jgi:hypothetical protein
MRGFKLQLLYCTAFRTLIYFHRFTDAAQSEVLKASLNKNKSICSRYFSARSRTITAVTGGRIQPDCFPLDSHLYIINVLTDIFPSFTGFIHSVVRLTTGP